MDFDHFRIHATPQIEGARCRHCMGECKPVPNGLFGQVLYCSFCEIVYRITMVKVPKNKVSDEYLEQCRRFITK